MKEDAVNGTTALRGFLGSQPPGRLPPAASETVRGLLMTGWDELRGSGDEHTYAEKLYRAEDLTWDPPILRFILERHGGTVRGSTRAELHRWEVDVDRGVATCNTSALGCEAPCRRSGP